MFANFLLDFLLVDGIPDLWPAAHTIYIIEQVKVLLMSESG